MNISLGLFALCLLGAEGPSSRDAHAITYDVRVLKLEGLEWRGAFFSRLQPVASRAGTTVWTASRETAHELAEKDPSVLKTPRVTTMSGVPATISDRTTRKIASGMTRLADGPFDHATKVAYTPNYQELREGFMVTMSGRKLDQGVLACVVIDETRVTAVHHVALSESVGAKESCAAGCAKVVPRIEVPEVSHAAVDGEWLIPNEGALVVSLGVQTTADAAGKAAVAERVVLIEARATGDDPIKEATQSPEFAPGLHPRGAVAEAPEIPVPMPALPTRSLPQPLAADGTPLPLPPLPENPPPPTTLPGSSEPSASPQGSHLKPEPTTLDPASVKAGFSLQPKETEPEKEKAKSDESSPPARPYMLRFPMNFEFKGAKINIEIEIPASYLFRNMGFGNLGFGSLGFGRSFTTLAGPAK